jgi:hypothetical protein
MKIKKFYESSQHEDIEEMLLDFKDDGFEVETEYIKKQKN